MPSQRKRIGFLPSEEVHEIIENICLENKFSQSKVTGLLVEEALRSRGILNNVFSENKTILGNFSNKISNNDYSTLENKSSIYNNLDKKDEKKYYEDLKMINEFIEFKLFKKIMNKNKNVYD